MSGRFGKLWLPASQPCFLQDAGHSPGLARAAKDEEQPAEGQGILYCRQCHAPVTSDQQRLRVQGKHSYTLANPHGIVFAIGCFSGAPGCRCQGQPTREFSWFPPQAWCFALCRKCQTHLGWYYEAGPQSSFYGLIVDRLEEES